MNPTEELMLVLKQILQINLFDVIFLFIITATVFMLLKIVAESLAGYIQFRLDKFISIGSPVEIYDKKGRIKGVTIFTVTVETDCGFIRIPTKTWRNSKFLTLKDQMILHTRRKDDKEKRK